MDAVRAESDGRSNNAETEAVSAWLGPHHAGTPCVFNRETVPDFETSNRIRMLSAKEAGSAWLDIRAGSIWISGFPVIDID
jgi:hypothetical protein